MNTTTTPRAAGSFLCIDRLRSYVAQLTDARELAYESRAADGLELALIAVSGNLDDLRAHDAVVDAVYDKAQFVRCLLESQALRLEAEELLNRTRTPE